MSLFGTSPEGPSEGRGGKDLFGDDVPSRKPATASNSLFADDDDGLDSSPWSMPTPKRNGRQNVVQSLLADANVPDSYIDAFDTIVAGSNSNNGRISGSDLLTILNACALSDQGKSRIQRLVLPSGTEGAQIGRSEFNVLLALIGLAEEGEEATLDAVDERKQTLPVPSMSFLASFKSRTAEPPTTPKSQQKIVSATPVSSNAGRKAEESFESNAAEPWSTPASQLRSSAAESNDTPRATAAIGTTPTRTTSTYTTQSTDQEALSITGGEAGSGGWNTGFSAQNMFSNSANAAQGQGFRSPEDNTNGFGGAQSRALGGGVGGRTGRGVEETVTVVTLPDKEGLFMFQHRNYEVKCTLKGTTVVRRYSDFVWLLDCLHKRYPFRQLPLLPPKRVAVNGRHLSSDVTFIEKRRRGLVRFANALVRHPVLAHEQLVTMFLTVPTELAVWRKQATIAVEEEFTGRVLPPDLEDSLPLTLIETFDQVRQGVKRSTEGYINMCAMVERLAKRNVGVALDSLRFATSLQGLMQDSPDTYATDTNDVPLLNEGLSSVARHYQNLQALLDDEARAWEDGVLEDLKRQRDTLVSVRDMFDRRDRLSKDNIPQLERRIQSNEGKLQALRMKPEGLVKPGEEEKLSTAIMNDKQSIVDQHARAVFIRECIRDELVFFQQSQYHVSRLHQDWSQDRVKYAELQAENWRSLNGELEHMPVGES